MDARKVAKRIRMEGRFSSFIPLVMLIIVVALGLASNGGEAPAFWLIGSALFGVVFIIRIVRAWVRPREGQQEE
ncbi:hypothetical protein [Homoserinibacter sp. GY 40078]|uniref:hypothetical protein n=1 Tax=Homoserinibacter sp. GY 40078 TaxID=2603275 RepID=UPI0011CBBCAA|nr:hypothetical protein [Homoserinibacter sp. GY 40078]TXK19322.1 hypothetical protein FVQ89_05250 [Homoserinibacter sp. GY 40078]